MDQSPQFDLDQLSRFLTSRLGHEVRLTGAEKVGSGYHSDGYKLTADDGRMFFLKRVKSHDLGFEIPERKVSSLLVSQGMADRYGQQPKPIGVVLLHEQGSGLVPVVDETTEIFHVQEYEPVGESYLARLEARKSKTAIDDEDHSELKTVMDMMLGIHAVPFPSDDPVRRKSVYNDGLRAPLIHPELTFMLLHDFADSSDLLNREEQKRYVGLMYDQVHRWKDRTERLCALHGDFWGANVFFRPDGSAWVIDFSRIPWGDSAIDVGWWMSSYLWYYHETGNPYFRQLADAWLALYEERTGDKDIREAIVLTLGLQGLVHITPRFFPNLDHMIGKKFLNHIWQILEKGTFAWPK